MDRERITSTLLAGVAGLALAAQPVAAQASSSDAAITGLNEKLLVVAIPITILVEAVLIYTVLKYKDQDEAKPTRENRRLEITWTIATAAVLLFVGISASITMADDSVITPDDPEISADTEEQVNVTAYRYGWTFDYPEYNVSTEPPNQPLYVAQGQATYFSLTTDDWLHAFHVPTLGLKHDAVPGKIAWLKTTPTQVGTYQGYCAEYCGVGHSGMMFEVQVLEDREALVSQMESLCDEAANKEWNGETNTCEWAPDSSGSNGNSSASNESVSASGSANANADATPSLSGPATDRTPPAVVAADA
ncbi:cytochrome c oxidase subunit II [Halorubellus sp. JP-L1]|uniref:cytochrome c oxidase subunit II n=1 Tax=Halorubellus sp. JP-L1 TaxID=2715753 RepID=UPI00140A5095|nr:cytochrome c oxidase subunit II [Halorubellus sp. JP-L1]NHN42570.1 cytochrome c oxidase subunit II [Halorubellus sp. JP-L1]